MNTKTISMLICGALALATPRLVLARTDGAGEPVAVEVGGSVAEATVVRKWMMDAASRGMAAARVAPADVASGRIVAIEISGELLDYHYRVGVRAGGEWVGDPIEESCECGDDDLVARVEDAVEAVAPRLRGDAAPPSTSPPPPKPGRDEKQRLSASGKAGAALVGVGAAATIAGVVLVALPPRWRVDEAAPEHESGKTYRLPGGIVAGVGAAMVVVGAVLIHRDRKPRRVTAAPAAARGFVGMGASVRF